MTYTDFDERAVNTIRFLAVDAVQKANSGHPGLPMGAAPMAYVLWTKFLKVNPHNPQWFDRDRFVLSAGHGSMLLYSLLHLTGYNLPLDQLKNFRQWGSETAGHPEHGDTPGVETTTGPLGQGFGNAVGMAVAEAFLAAKFNRDGHNVVDHYTYALVSDGDVMEGVAAEAASLAGHWKLGKLIMLYDDNGVTLDGQASMIFSENVPQRFDAYGWHTLTVKDGNDMAAIEAAIRDAQGVTDQPTLISVKTVIGYGSPNKANTHHAHGSPLGEDEVKLTKENLGWPLEPEFLIPADVLAHFRQRVEQGQQWENEWNEAIRAYSEAYPDLAEEFAQALSGQLPGDWDADIPVYEEDARGTATRNISGELINVIAPRVPTFLGGDADLAGSTKTLIKGEGHFAVDGYNQRNLGYGVREHAMGGLNNGFALHGGIKKPYTATFFVFSDYMRPTLRLAALMGIETVHVFTHDSIGLGEDGPTHQPIEHLAAMRAIPNMVVLRPADANEVSGAWKYAMQHAGGPVSLVLTRQSVPVFDYEPDKRIDLVAKGAYVLVDAHGTPDVILMGSGSEVAIAVEAMKLLAEDGIQARVVSVPSFELFERQDAAYRASVLPPEVKARVAIEAGVRLGWDRYLGDGVFIGLDRFGASAPYEDIYQHLGLTPEAVAQAAKSQL
ncbi:MAG: transketolase [Chloroflexi bacterium]|nr:transketolase [Chloroflexota bacterium]